MEGLKSEKKDVLFEKVLVLKGRYRFATILKEGKLFIVHENILNEFERQQWRDMKKENPELSKTLEPKKKYDYDAIVLDIKTKFEILRKNLGHISAIISSLTNNDDIVTLLYLDRRLSVLNPYTIDSILETKIEGSGAILSAELTERSLYISPKSGVLVQIRLDEVKGEFPPLLNTDLTQEQLSSVTVYKLPGSGIDSKVYCILLKDPQTVIIFFEDGINIIDLASNKTKKISCFNITCCGIALNNVRNLESMNCIFIWLE